MSRVCIPILQPRASITVPVDPENPKKIPSSELWAVTGRWFVTPRTVHSPESGPFAYSTAEDPAGRTACREGDQAGLRPDIDDREVDGVEHGLTAAAVVPSFGHHLPVPAQGVVGRDDGADLTEDLSAEDLAP